MTQNNLGNALWTLGRARERDGAAGGGGGGLSRRAGGKTRERVPLEWARRRTTSATRSRTLGERESGTARLEEAVAAYRAALEERTRERVPLDWARTQMNLGNALWRSASARAGRRGWRRRWRPIARRWRNARASGCRSTGR